MTHPLRSRPTALALASLLSRSGSTKDIGGDNVSSSVVHEVGQKEQFVSCTSGAVPGQVLEAEWVA